MYLAGAGEMEHHVRYREDVVFSKPSVFLADIPDYVDSRANAHPDELAKVRAETFARCPQWADIMSSATQASFLNILVGVSGARRILEIGTFTGYSALSMASALPDDGELITIDSFEAGGDAQDVARSAFAESSCGDRITQVLGKALDVIATIDGSFDLIFLDADKSNLLNYFNYVLEHGLLRPDGLLVVDNTLWGGKVLDAGERPVAEPDDSAPADQWLDQMLSYWAYHVARFNTAVARDERVESVLLPVHDGMTLIRHRRLK
jgi:caffeoyl-CoA O-methyltransferase